MREALYDAAIVRELLGKGGMRLTGRTSWKRNRTRVRATWLLEGGQPDFDCYLDFGVSVRVPANYTVGFRIGEDPLEVRVDVRGAHRQPDGEFINRSHVHDVRTRGEENWALVPPPVPPFWRLEDLDFTPAEYFNTLGAFCRYLQIDMLSFVWMHPPLDRLDQVPMLAGGE